ncbi:hypothetical protein HYC85_028845 [Camellia sinensis]|uniref:Uncharacterized protein n=1 Tax=Camellia sinensis TaxID=4442 RepID=A0A7J7G094_CAMSI|nr:hypothetical protein HYC85_028845 [Camellia sinensis]
MGRGSGSESNSDGWGRARGLVLKTLVLIGGAILLRRLTKSTTGWDHTRIVARSLTGDKYSREQAFRDPDNYFNLRPFGGRLISPFVSTYAIRDAEEYKNYCDRPKDQRPQPEEVIGAELDELKKSRKKDCEDANNAGFNEAEENYKKQVFATQDIYFKAGWKAACQQLGQGPDTDVFAFPPAVFLPTYLIPYANDVFSALQVEAEEGLQEEDEGEAEGEDQTEQEQAGQTGTGVQDPTATDIAEHLTTIYLKRCERGKRCLYEGSTPPDGFPNSWNGAAYCTSELSVLKNNEIHTWDRGYDDDGNQVWGVRGGPYEFKPAPASSFVDMFPLNFPPQSMDKRIEGSFVLQE